MPACTASHNDDVLCVYQLLAIFPKGREDNMVILRVLLVGKQASAHAVSQTVGLVVYLLQHEVVEAALAEFADVEVYGLDVITA